VKPLPFITAAHVWPGESFPTPAATLSEKAYSLRLEKLLDYIQDKLRDQAGQDLIEYALVASLIAFAAVATMQALAADISTAYGSIAAALTSAG
jgi:pilus assembly protein Flp/PilA